LLKGIEERIKMTDLQEKMQESIDAAGWTLISTADDEEEITYSHTVGLYKTYQIPELVIVGLSQDVASEIIVEFIERIEHGEKLLTQKRYKSINPDYLDDEFILIKVDDAKKTKLMHIMENFYKDIFPNVDVLQILWQDDNDFYPFEKGCVKEAVKAQQLLGNVEVLRIK